jgi:hypothetical protein
MSQITFKDWKVSAVTEGTDVLRLNVEALDGSDIIELGFTGEGAGREGEPYLLRFSTEQLEANQHSRPGRAVEAETSSAEGDDEGGQVWETDDEETLYTRGWEIQALVDEEGVLNLEVERQDDAEVFALEPLESGVPLAAHVVVRLAAEEEIEDEDEDRDEDDDVEGDLDELEDQSELDEFYDYDDDVDTDEDEDDEMMDLLDEDEGRY